MNCGERKRVPFHDSRVRWQGSEGRGKEACFACDVAMAFTSITSAGLPGVLIKITSGSSHMLILGALKDSANTSACSWEVGGGGAFICVPLCGRDVCVCVFVVRLCACVFAKRFFFFLCKNDCNSCWGGGKGFWVGGCGGGRWADSLQRRQC